MAMTDTTVLLLAGKRNNALDPLAAARDVEMKCIIPFHGEPMIVRPFRAIMKSERVGPILICSNDPDAICAAVPEIAAARDSGRVSFVDAEGSIADSIVAASEHAEMPLMVTTADNVMLSPEMIDRFLDEAAEKKAQGAMAFAQKEMVQAAHKDGQARFYEFSDIGVATCNLYLVRERKALSAVDVFRTGGQFVKNPSRIAKAFGIMSLVRFYLGIGTLNGFFSRVSRRFGFKLVPIVLPDGALAVDVDNERTYEVATMLFAKRHHLA